MRRKQFILRVTIFVSVACVLLYACREKFVPTINEPTTGFLVVDGFINAGTGPTTIFLSRTTKLSSAPSIVREAKADVRVFSSAGTSFSLAETSPGIYTHPQLTVIPSQEYWVMITTADGKKYESDHSTVHLTPPIDSVYWKMESGGVQVYADTHDNTQAVGYYQFKFIDTWEFHSKYTTALKVVNQNGLAHHIGYRDSVAFGDDFSVWRCWKSDTLNRILITSTEKLTKNIVALRPITFIEPGSVKLDVRYSIDVKLYSLSRAAHEFNDQLRKNTELIGSIFDAQPSSNFGNVRCTSHPSESVMGFIEVTEEKTKRIFINAAQIPNWVYVNVCGEEIKIANTGLDLRGKDSHLPTHLSDGNASRIDSAYFAPKECVDCTTKGTNQKPVFW